MANTSPCTDKPASSDIDNNSKTKKTQSPPYPRSSLISRLSRRFHHLTSAPKTESEDEISNSTTISITESTTDTPQSQTHRIETENKDKLAQQNLEELEDLQERCRNIQAELDRYMERCEELEELCRDFQVTFLSNYLESQKVESEMRDVLRYTEMGCLQKRSRGDG
ncbi:hypothetical protein BDV06DRAFT_225106 [Aspergillus oleicola]